MDDKKQTEITLEGPAEALNQLAARLEQEKNRSKVLGSELAKARCQIASMQETARAAEDARILETVNRNALAAKNAAEAAERRGKAREEAEKKRSERVYIAAQRNAKRLFLSVVIGFLCMAVLVLFGGTGVVNWFAVVGSVVCGCWFGWELNDAVRLLR